MKLKLMQLMKLFHGIHNVNELPDEAVEIVYEMINSKIEEEKEDREDYAEKLKKMSDDELRQFVPDVYAEDIYSIDYAKLLDHGIQLISFDIDDTIADTFLDKAKAAVPGVKVTMPDKAKELMKKLHEMGFTVTLLTNARKAVAKDAADELGVDGYICRAEKPNTKNFKKMLSTYKVTGSQMAHVGNNICEDILGGNRAGVTTCLVRRAGVTMKAVKKGLTLVGIESKGHLVREELKERNIWRKHHKNKKGDQYYQLGELPGYLR